MSGSEIFIRVTSLPYVSRGTELTRIIPFPALRVARAIAVLRFPLVLMIFAMVNTLELRSEECAHCTERYKCRVIQPVHMCLIDHFHLFSHKFYRNTDSALLAL